MAAFFTDMKQKKKSKWPPQKNLIFQLCQFPIFLYAKNQGGSYEVASIPALWMVSSESLKRLYPN